MYRESETREVKSLDGMWNFVKSNASSPDQGVTEGWFMTDLRKVRFVYKMKYRNELIFLNK